MDANKLLHCPFCGSKALKVTNRRERDPYRFKEDKAHYQYQVRCNKCMARGPIASAYTENGRITKHDTLNGYPHQYLELEAADKWNRRG